MSHAHRYAFVSAARLPTNGRSGEHVFAMTTDARGGLWLSDPVLVFALLSSLWVLIAWLSWGPDRRQLGQRPFDGFGWIRVVAQRARQVGVVGAQIKVAVARQIEEDDRALVRLAR